MIDALGRPQSVLLLGGTSEIGLAIVRALPAERLRRVVLLGRDKARLESAAARLGETLPAGTAISIGRVEAADLAAHEDAVGRVFDGGDVDVTIMAVGVLGNQQVGEDDPTLALRTAQITFTGALSLLLHAGRRLRDQGHGVVIVLSSVAGRQARRSNWLYGAAKAGLDFAALGLGDTLAEAGVHVLVVRPGFVRSRMTAGLPVPPLATDPETVGRVVAQAVRARRTVVHVPGAFGPIGAVLGVLPRRILRRLPF